MDKKGRCSWEGVILVVRKGVEEKGVEIVGKEKSGRGRGNSYHS